MVQALVCGESALSMKKVKIYSDGGCVGNPGPGGWAALLVHEEKQKLISGGELATTNNRMELTAAIEALRALKVPCEVEFFTDSQYLRKGISEWVALWKRRKWQTINKTPVANAELWRELDTLAARHKVTWHWVRGHSGHVENEKCDEAARAEIDKIRSKFTKLEMKSALEEFLAKKDQNPAQSNLL